jgi:hypothetical protein
VAKFEELVAQAGYDLDDGQTIEKFTNGLPVSLWGTVYDLDEPTTYEQWRNATMKRQQKWLHRESVKRAQHNLNNFRSDNRPANNVFAKFINPPHDPNAMDLSRGRARTANCTQSRRADTGETAEGDEQGRLSLTEDNGRPKPLPYAPRQGYHERTGNTPRVKCFYCDFPGHLARDCRKKKRDLQNKTASKARAIVNDHDTPKEKADAWLRGVAAEDDEVKGLVLQELTKGGEDFQDA